MDWADDVAYSVHDVEDGVHAGHVQLDGARPTRAAVCELAADTYSAESAADLAAVLDDLLALPVLRDLADYDGSRGAQVALKRATSELIGRFVSAAVAATRERAGDGPLRRYAADLVVPRRVAAECALLKGVAARYVMNRRDVAAVQARQRELLTELAGLLADRAPGGARPGTAPGLAGRARRRRPAAGGRRPGRRPHRPVRPGLARPPGRVSELEGTPWTRT